MHAGTATPLRAYLAPFATFLACLMLGDLVTSVFEGAAAWPMAAPRYWMFPLQTAICGALLAWYWKAYELRAPRGAGFALAIGIAVLLIWIAPQEWLGRPPRLEGFNPWFFVSPATNAASIAIRFVRLVIVVPLVEEIFWRGFLLRWMIDPRFEQVPFGTFRPAAFAATTVGFCLEHTMSDWPAALLAGVLYNWVAIRTKSLSACVLAHAITNLLLGLYVMKTGQWGFW